MNQELLIVTPPFTQLNTPYPATAYIKGFLNTKGISAYQMDLGIEVILDIFSKKGLEKLFEYGKNKAHNSENTKLIYALKQDYIRIIDQVIQFLQGQNATLARQICQDNYLPEASRFHQDADFTYAFGNMGLQDKAKHLATLFLEDISDFIVACVDPYFGFSRYAERLGRSANSFDEIYEHLQKPHSYIDQVSIEIFAKKIQTVKPKLVCISVPFPGNLFAAFRMAQFIKKQHSEIKICMGGGFPNTELRELKDVRVFEFFDFISLDDGELPLELIIKSLKSGEKSLFKRTFVLENNRVVYKNDTKEPDYKQVNVGTPDYSDLYLNKYISVIEVTNPMHSLWSDGRWNKLTLAHGCYWGKCTFCDISLDYIKLYEPVAAKTIVDRMEQLVAQTTESGFHFVDEAAPPALMREVALEILRRGLSVTWWTNIRFEKSFTYDLCVLLRASGCIAVSGGLEVASDRLLALIEKGVTVKQVAKVCENFANAGIMVHAYLMYGYPTQTVQETVDSLEMVRQMFQFNLLQSGFWHQFAMTAHSPVGQNPELFGVIPDLQKITFANNDVNFTDKTGIDHDKFSFGLKKSLHNFMHGQCFEFELKEWFDFKTPETSISENYIYECLQEAEIIDPKPNDKLIWMCGEPQIDEKYKSKTTVKYLVYDKKEIIEVLVSKNHKEAFEELIKETSIKHSKVQNYGQIKQTFESKNKDDFDNFFNSNSVSVLREHGILLVV